MESTTSQDGAPCSTPSVHFASDGFMPFGHCYPWGPEVLWLHVTSDALIILADLLDPVHAGVSRAQAPALSFCSRVWGPFARGNEVPGHVDRILSKPPRLAELRMALAEFAVARTFNQFPQVPYGHTANRPAPHRR